jgi:hypothetical protein
VLTLDEERAASIAYQSSERKMQQKRIVQIEHKSEYQLPASYYREIGRVIVRWAFFEKHVQTMICNIAFACDADRAVLGRLCIAEQSFPQRMDLLRRLAKIRRIELDQTLWKTVREKSKRLIAERNLFAHGCWSKHPTLGWTVRETRGEWEKSKDGPQGSKKVIPESIQTDPRRIRKVVTELMT